MRRVCIVVVVPVVALFGCREALRAPSPSQPTVAAAPGDILLELRQILTPMTSLLVSADRGAGAPRMLRDAHKEQVLAGLREAKAKHEGADAGKEALKQFSHEIVEMIQQARELDRWKLVLGGVDAYEVLNEPSPRMERLRKRALIHFDRPRVAVKGYFEDLAMGEAYAFLQVSLRDKDEVHMVQVRPGDEFLGLRFIDFVGNKKGVELEYLKAPNDTFKVMGP